MPSSSRGLAFSRSKLGLVSAAAVVFTLLTFYVGVHELTYLNQLIVDLRETDHSYSLSHPLHLGLVGDTRHHYDDEELKACRDIHSLLDVSQWPDTIFFEDHPDFSKPDNHDPNREENVAARATVAEFNRIRNSVLTTDLLDEGINDGSLYAAQSFARRFLERGKNARPLSVAVTGNSFTIGSNCGENAVQPSEGPVGCAWPQRLAQRWKELVTRSFGNTTNSEIEWRMLQANAQASNNVMHRLPSLIDEYHSNNKTLDVLILNNGITDDRVRGAWFEALVRHVLDHFPQIVIISLVDGIPHFVDDTTQGFLGNYILTQDHYNLTRIDFAKMCRLLRDSGKESYNTLRQQYPKSSLLWPQVDKLMYANGTTLTEEISSPTHNDLQLYWANYTPRVEKTKHAYYPLNHPPWTTHQYVADAVLYALLSVLKTGMGCVGSTIQKEIAAKSPLPETTVEDKAEVERCFVCQKPIDQLDARSHNLVVNGTGTSNNDTTIRESPVVVTCGDWKWITDERKRSGWQSDEAGSLIRFRLKVSEIPTMSLTYMASHATFGNFLVTFQTIPKAKTTPLMGCSDVAKFKNKTLLPSMELEGRRQQFSLWDTFIFSGQLDSNDFAANDVMKKTVLDKMGESEDVEYVDMYVLNDNYYYYGNEKSVKIQTVTSC